MIAILLVRARMKRAPLAETRPKLDYVGAALSAAGLGLVVFSILKTSEWGWIQPLGALTINGHEITPFGFSVVPFLILAGLGILWRFAEWEGRRERRGEDVLLDRTLLRIVHMRAGLLDAADAAADPDGHVLRAARVPPGRARLRRVRDGQAAVPAVGGAAARRADRAEARGAAGAEARLPGRARRAHDRRVLPRRHDRRGAERHRLRDRAGGLRRRRRACCSRSSAT